MREFLWLGGLQVDALNIRGTAREQVAAVAEARRTVLSKYPNARIAVGRYGRVRIITNREILSNIIGSGTSVARRSAAWLDAAEQLKMKRRQDSQQD